MVVIDARGIGVRYGANDVLVDLDIDVVAGRSLAIIGPNGSGKSTLLHVLAGVLDHTGTVERNGSVALVQQVTTLDPTLPLSVREVVRLGRYRDAGLWRRLRPTDHEAVDEALDRLGLVDLAERSIHDLSGGQRQRVLVAQGLVQRADVVLLDEPVNGLDPVAHDRILDLVAEECRADRAAVMTTHRLDDAACCDRVLVLAHGCGTVGTPDEVLTEPVLRDAFGGRLARVGDNLVLDDPHHH